MGKKLFLFAAAAVALASCTETDLSGDTSFAKESTSDAIQFSAKAGNSGVTRAYEKGTIGNETQAKRGITNLTEAGFGVFAYYTEAETNYDPATTTDSVPNFMYNQSITWSTAVDPDAWVYSPVKYWPNGIDADNKDNPSHTAKQSKLGKLSFFAVAPFTTTPTEAYSASSDGKKPNVIGADATNDEKVKKNNADKGIVAMTTNEFTGNVWVKYLMPNATQSEAVDLLWGLAGKAKYDETDGVDPAFTIGKDYNLNLTKQNVGERVSFLFKHALAKVGGATTVDETEELTGEPKQCGFKVVADVDKNDGDDQKTYFPSSFKPEETLITLKEVRIQDGYSAGQDVKVTTVENTTTSNFNTFGWFNIETGSWCTDDGTYGVGTAGGATYNIIANNTNTNLDDTEYTLNEKIREAATYGKHGSAKDKMLADDGTKWDGSNPTGVTTTPQALFTKENVPGLLVIPGGTNSNDLYITVDYYVRTADPNLSQGFTVVEQKITNKVSLGALNPNKYYTIIMHLGLTSVKFEAVVADWAAKETEAYNPSTGADESTGNDNESKVWLPSNVVSANQWAISPASLSFKAMGQSIPLTSVTMNGGSPMGYQASPADESHYSLSVVGSPAPAWLSIESDGKVKAEPNTNIAKRTAAVNVSTKVNGNTITTPITVEQAGFSLEKTSATDATVTVKDGDDQVVSSGYTYVVSDGDGLGTATNSGEAITVAGTAGKTYKVTVTHTSGATWSGNVTIPAP